MEGLEFMAPPSRQRGSIILKIKRDLVQEILDVESEDLGSGPDFTLLLVV